MSPVVDGGRGRFSSSSSSFHLLEVTIVSAQDLHPALLRMRPYAVVWVDPDRERLRTRSDPSGRSNPTWNDKFVFRVDDRDLRSDEGMAAVTVVIRASRGGCGFLLRDPEVGTARLLLSSLLLLPPGGGGGGGGASPQPGGAQRCVALQVRRPGSLRPQGILNVAVALLDAASLRDLRSLRVLCGGDDRAPSALAYRDILPFSAAAGKGGKGPKGGKEKKTKERKDKPAAVAAGSKQPLERNKSVEEGKWVGLKEQEALESKLEQWRMDLSPDYRDTSDWSRTLRRGLRRGWRPFSCCCGCSGAAKY